MARCELHEQDQIWMEVGPGKSVLRCPGCHNKEKALHTKALDFPRVKWAQNFFRDRPYNEKERSTPFGKARKPVD